MTHVYQIPQHIEQGLLRNQSNFTKRFHRSVTQRHDMTSFTKCEEITKIREAFYPKIAK